MAAQLEIQDGNPLWYLSPDIWVVPGDDPEGPPGMPVAGSPAYLWARVRNNGDTAAQNATVRFYWANPNVGFDRNTANPIGSAFVTLAPNAQSEVLCLTPWIPEYVNQGHECVLAEAFHASDPLPATPDFNVPTDRHVAQLNLSVVNAADGMFRLAFNVHNTWRSPRTFRIVASQEQLKSLAAVKWAAKLAKQGTEKKVRSMGLITAPCPSPDAIRRAQRPELEVKVGAHQRMGVTLAGMVEKGAALIRVEQFADGKLVGGLAAVVIGQ